MASRVTVNTLRVAETANNIEFHVTYDDVSMQVISIRIVSPDALGKARLVVKTSPPTEYRIPEGTPDWVRNLAGNQRFSLEGIAYTLRAD